MAATVSAWAKPGAWALDSEEHEEELQEQHQKEKANGGFFGGSNKEEPLAAEFPSLAAAATKPKKKKGQTLSLGEFNATSSARSAQPTQVRGLTTEDLMMLPTGPRQRTAEELDRSRLGGGFRSYGSYDSGRNNRYANNDESSNPRWGSSRASDEPRRNGGYNRDSNRETMPSRADEINDWAAAKRTIPMSNGFERRERGGFFDSQSKADESDNWTSNKSFVPSEGRRFGSGGGFDRDRRRDYESFPKEASNGGGADSETWGKKKEEVVGDGSVRPKLVLQPRTLPVSEEKQEESVTPVKSKGSNPFGEARPREEVLKEKGQDWKKIDEKLESMKIKEAASPDGEASSAKRSFRSGSRWGGFNEDPAERNWKKTGAVDARSPSAETAENGHAEEN